MFPTTGPARTPSPNRTSFSNITKARNEYEKHMKQLTHMNKIVENLDRLMILGVRLRKLRNNKNAKPANFKNLHKNLRNTKNRLNGRLANARAALTQTPYPIYLVGYGGHNNTIVRLKQDIFNRYSRHLRMLQARSRNVMPRVPTNNQIRTIQRFSRGLIARKRMNNPYWGRTYANVVAGRPGIGAKSVMRKFKNL